MKMTTISFAFAARCLLVVAMSASVSATAQAKGNGCCCGPKTLFSWNTCCECVDACECVEAGDEEGSENDIEFELEMEEDEPLVTDRPDFTESSSTVGLGRMQLELGYSFGEDDSGGVRTRTHSAPQALWRIGMFREWFELRIGQTWIEERTTVAGVQNTQTGADDLYIGAKIALTEQCGCWPEMAILPQALVPTGADAFSRDEFMPGLNWVYSWELSDCVSLAGSTQGNRAVDDAGKYYTEFAQSVAIGFGLTDRLGAYSEWFAFFPHSATVATRPQHVINGGFTYLITNDIQIYIEAGFGLNGPAEDFFAGTGLAIRW